MYNNRKFIIFNSSELHKVDFTQVLDTSINTLRKSLDGTKVLIKYEGTPSFIDSITTLEGIFNYQEIIYILSGEEWSEQQPEPDKEIEE